MDKKKDETKHRTEWCAEASKCRCMRGGRGSKYMKIQGKCTGPKYLSTNMGKWRKRHLGGHDMIRRMDRGRSPEMLQKMLGLCETENGTKFDELLQAGASGHQRVRQDVNTNSDSRRRQGPCQRGKNWKIEGQKR